MALQNVKNVKLLNSTHCLSVLNISAADRYVTQENLIILIKKKFKKFSLFYGRYAVKNCKVLISTRFNIKDGFRSQLTSNNRMLSLDKKYLLKENVSRSHT